MKTLYQQNAGRRLWTLEILNDDNYIVYDANQEKHKPRYFGQMEPALRELSRLCANEAGNDLAGWIKELQAVHTELEGLVKA